MDGTIIDSEPIWFIHQADIVREKGGYWDDDMSSGMVGMNLIDAAVYMIETSRIDADPEEFLAELRPGAYELLDELRTAGVPIALVTASYASFAEEIARDAGGFDVVVPGDRVSRGKPDPEGYLLAARLLGVDIEKCVAIEDSPNGLQAARASGARCLAVPHMAQIPEAPGLSRVSSLADVTLETIVQIAEGRPVDLIAA
jgi:HAD superfamily hydrolase (TIGR01509 family)